MKLVTLAAAAAMVLSGFLFAGMPAGCSAATPTTQPDPILIVIADGVLATAQIGAQSLLASGKITPVEYAAIETVLQTAQTDISGGTNLTAAQVQEIETAALAAVESILIAPPPQSPAANLPAAKVGAKALARAHARLHK